jgi:hypothetical protein
MLSFSVAQFIPSAYTGHYISQFPLYISDDVH